MNSNNMDVIVLQKTRTSDEVDLQKRGYKAGYTLIGAIHHKQYRIATYAKEDIDKKSVVYKNNSKNLEILATARDNITIISV